MLTETGRNEIAESARRTAPGLRALRRIDRRGPVTGTESEREYVDAARKAIPHCEWRIITNANRLIRGR